MFSSCKWNKWGKKNKYQNKNTRKAKKKRLAVRVSETYRQTCIHQYLMLKKIDFPKECFVLLQKMKKKRTTKLLVL